MSEDREAILGQPCRFCLRLAVAKVCSDCQFHYNSFGHLPEMVRHQKPPGRPRIFTRICGRCGRELEVTARVT